MMIGTCSWKYESWADIVYSSRKPSNYLAEYSQRYTTVEVDQWFWSLFPGDKVVLPKAAVVEEYAASVPEGFLFSVKVPNSITLTHHYTKAPGGELLPNPHFLSVDLMCRFLASLGPLKKHLGPVIFQFEYLNRQKISGVGEFLSRFNSFIEQLPSDYRYCVELRNPNWLTNRYFDFLQESGLAHVFMQGYYMPSIFELYQKHCERIEKETVIRLHGPDRKGIEQQTGKDWSKIVAPKERDIDSLTEMVRELQTKNVTPYIYVNNHFEGSAPRTIERILERI